MPQALIYLEKEENDIIERYSKKWNISKAEVIKRIILNFEEKK